MGKARSGTPVKHTSKSANREQPDGETSPPTLISHRIEEPSDWRGQTLARVRKLIRAADPDVVEEWKWKGTSVWSHDGILCTGETYKSVVKLTFAKGAALDDPAGLFNSSLDGNVRRAIDLHEGDTLDESAFKTLIRAAVAHNASGKKKKADKTPKLLSGGNPQIAKAYGDEAVQAYIAAMPGWKSDVGRRLDQIISRTVPGVRKAVKWNSPLYGAGEEGTWFLGIHCFAKYVKVAFFRGADLRPMPPGTSKQKHVRYLDIYEESAFDEAQVTRWVKQASELPGEKM